MEEKSKVIFGNVMSDKVYKSAVKSKKKFIKKFGDDSNVDYPIYIQKNEVISDAIGNRKNAWKDYYTCYATVSAEAGKESTDASLVVDDSKIDFTIRYCKKAAALTSTGYRVQFGGELYDILAVDHMNFKRKCIKLSCQKVRR